MDAFLRDINSAVNKKEEEARLAAAAKDAKEIEELQAKAAFPLNNYLPSSEGGKLEESMLNELFGGRDKKADAAREYARKTGKSARVRRNMEAPTKGGVDNSGRLAELVKEFGKAQMVDGKLPKMPNGMTRADYEIWVAALLAQMDGKNTTDTGPKMGPTNGDIIQANGMSWIVTNANAKKNGKLYAEIKNKEGDVKMVDWSKLPQPREVEGKSVYKLN